MMALALALAMTGAQALHPAANHRGVWTEAPRRTPSSMVRAAARPLPTSLTGGGLERILRIVRTSNQGSSSCAIIDSRTYVLFGAPRTSHLPKARRGNDVA
jgi:hypothetical protein